MGKKQAAEEEMYFKYVYHFLQQNYPFDMNFRKHTITDLILLCIHMLFFYSCFLLFLLFSVLFLLCFPLCICYKQGVKSRSNWLHWSSITGRRLSTTKRRLNVCSGKLTATRERSGSWSMMTEEQLSFKELLFWRLKPHSFLRALCHPANHECVDECFKKLIRQIMKWSV